MSETATVRATSLLASAGILSGLVIVALTFTYVLEGTNPFPEAPAFETVQEPRQHRRLRSPCVSRCACLRRSRNP